MLTNVSRAALHPALLMFIAQRHVERRILEDLHTAGFTDLTPAMARLAARLDDGGSRLTALADSAGVTKQTAHVLVKQLIAARYVRRIPDPHDGRARLIVGAARARRAMEVARRGEVEILDEWRSHLGARDLERLTAILTRLREITDLDGAAGTSTD